MLGPVFGSRISLIYLNAQLPPSIKLVSAGPSVSCHAHLENPDYANREMNSIFNKTKSTSTPPHDIRGWEEAGRADADSERKGTSPRGPVDGDAREKP